MAAKKSQTNSNQPNRSKLGRPGSSQLGLSEDGRSNGTGYEQQRKKSPYGPEEREKMLEKREKLTLEAFRIAYENHH